jgi:Fe-S-cluster containining protein
VRAYCLSIHAAYRCQSSGACCTAGWRIPIEPEHATALLSRGLALDGRTSRFVSGERSGAGNTPLLTLATTTSGACVFYDTNHDRLCSIHRDAGIELMPTACRNFPRVTLRDRRGVFVTLSHYCPTAAGLLLHARDIRAIPAPPSISLDGAVEGLDATGVMPPLLRPGMLADLDGYNAWEREGLAVLNDREYPAPLAVQVIGAATADACGWSPGDELLATRVARAFERARTILRPDPDAPRPAFDRPIKAFLAAHLFASWAAYQGGGLTAVVQSLEATLALVGDRIADEETFIAAVRSADLQLRHS